MTVLLPEHSLKHRPPPPFTSKELVNIHSDMSDAKEKRKHARDTVLPEIHKKAREPAVTDEEVEEFCAILRRIKTAVKYFKSTGDDVAALEKQIMQQVKGASSSRNHETLNLDLNVTPQPQSE
ncbi:hypothetical protein SESBI_04256 [Sesbania bispinosa]|nr:hypothetical protein SESBI_04256 [Sesbania bispinosa]